MVAENHTESDRLHNGLKQFDARLKKLAPTRIVWGMGDTARQLASLIGESVEERSDAQGLVQVFEPHGEPFTAFRDLLSRVAEATRMKGEAIELEVKVILACWELEDTDLTGLFRDISKILDVTLTVERTFTLSVLIPPPTANEAQLHRVFNGFLGLENVLGELPFLNSVFVYQLPIEVYGGTLAEAATTQDLVELMSREFADPDVLESIHQLVYPVLRLKQQTAGRSAMYSALGAQRLRYNQAELLRHLETRFQYELLREGLLDPDAIPDSVMERTTKLADECVIDCARSITPYKAIRPRSDSRLPLLSCVGNPQAMEGSAVDRKLDVAISVIQADLDPLFDELYVKLKQAFDDALALNGQNIACVRHFLELIEGWPAVQESDGKLSDAQGLFHVALDFSRTPFLNDSITFIQHSSESLAAESGVFPGTNDADTDSISTLDAYVEALQAALSDTDLKPRYLIPSLNATWSKLKTHGRQPWCGIAEARGLVRDVYAEFSSQFQRLAELLSEIEHGLQQNKERHDALRHVYPWYKRLFNLPAAYSEENRKLKDQHSEILKEREMLHHTITELDVLLRSAVDEVLWPQLLPAVILDGLRTRLGSLREELETFVERLAAKSSAQWVDAEKVTETDRLTETTTLNRHKLDFLYQQQLGSRSWGEYAQEMMVYDPPTFADCNNLCDHLYAGPDVLLARMAEYAAALFAPMRKLDVMDIIRIGGVEQAREFMLRMFSKTEYLPEFSTGMLPRAQERGSMKRVRIIRCSQQNKEKLQADFSGFMGENDCHLDIGNDEIIDITTLRSGFPAFVLHVLNNARQRMLEKDGSLEQDIWPN